MESSHRNQTVSAHRTLDLHEAADFLKVSEATAQEMAATGELPGAKIGRAWVFLLDDLAEWLRQQVRAQREERRAQRVVVSERSPGPSARVHRKRGKTPPPRYQSFPARSEPLRFA